MALTRQSTELAGGVERQIILQVGPACGHRRKAEPASFVWYGGARGAQGADRLARQGTARAAPGAAAALRAAPRPRASRMSATRP